MYSERDASTSRNSRQHAPSNIGVGRLETAAESPSRGVLDAASRFSLALSRSWIRNRVSRAYHRPSSPIKSLVSRSLVGRADGGGYAAPGGPPTRRSDLGCGLSLLGISARAPHRTAPRPLWRRGCRLSRTEPRRPRGAYFASTRKCSRRAESPERLSLRTTIRRCDLRLRGLFSRFLARDRVNERSAQIGK